MARRFVDISFYSARNMATDGNIDLGYWFDKTNEEKLSAASRMIEVAFQEPFFVQKKCQKEFVSVRKHQL